MTPVRSSDDIERRVLATAAEILWEGGLDALTVERGTESPDATGTLFAMGSSSRHVRLRLDLIDKGAIR